MSSIGNYLEQDHHDCDQRYAHAEALVNQGDWDGAGAEFAVFRRQLEGHLAMEEQVMFPALEQAMGSANGPTAVMRGEHGHMRAILQDMHAAIAQREQDDFFDHADTLRMLMRQHNLKEEGILYPMADRMLAPPQVAAVLAAMADMAKSSHHQAPLGHSQLEGVA
ncbi:hemerythrin domain-containing protein [Rugamonas sp. CCM 8940]|uniref:hemerythrin domain-containing protein n=1 Tax=Rugamonas sp. CCM 8940 TaxID=2765359 RepID=UPI0018F6CA5B|nr:hemerythrin domain-containing protein [Rugamonas sp. CCM 8940]MBJ7313479.1 hemerythrin domain-containing protein [Rugamonas sp. CCM 8940]